MINREPVLSMGPWNVALEIFMVGSGVCPLQKHCHWSGPGGERRMLFHERRSRATSRKIPRRGESAGDATSQSRLVGTAHETSRQSKNEIIFLF
jgi:hypothetical protein